VRQDLQPLGSSEADTEDRTSPSNPSKKDFCRTLSLGEKLRQAKIGRDQDLMT
jgi:hypothetical protein